MIASERLHSFFNRFISSFDKTVLLVHVFSIMLSSNHTILVTMHFTLHAVVFSLSYWSNVFFSAFAVAPFDFTNVDLFSFSSKSSFYFFSLNCFVFCYVQCLRHYRLHTREGETMLQSVKNLPGRRFIILRTFHI